MTPQQIEEFKIQRYNGTVEYLKRIHSDLMILRVRPDFPRPIHKPGQYCALGLGYWEPRVEGCQAETLTPDNLTRIVRRSYSISCSILDDQGQLWNIDSNNLLEFYIVLVRENSEGGRVPALTPRLFHLEVGSRLQIGERITGHFTLDNVQPEDDVIFLSTGTGEAPHNYMIWELLRRGHQGQIISACCVRYQRDLGYFSVHEKLMKDFPKYHYIPLTTRETASTQKRYIQDLITSGEIDRCLGRPLDSTSSHVFLCGNPKMIGVPSKNKDTGERVYPVETGVIELLERKGFQADHAPTKFKGNIHFEEYW